MIDTPEKRDITKEEAFSAMHGEFLDGLKDLNEILPELGHGESKRLLLAIVQYPLLTEDFTGEDALVKAFASAKRMKDALVAMGVETTLQAMLEQQFGNETGENNG